MADHKFSVRFFLTRKGSHIEWAGAVMNGVPRVGDEIMLGAGRNGEFPHDKDGKAAFRITRVIWGVEPADARNRIASLDYVNVEIEPAE